MSIFVVDKRSSKIVKPTKDMVMRQLSSLGVKVQAIIAGTSYAFGDELIPTAEEAVAQTRSSSKIKSTFSEANTWGGSEPQYQYTVSSFLRNANLADFMPNFGGIV